MATLIDTYSGIENKTSQPIQLADGFYEDRELNHPWETNNAKMIAESMWGQVDWSKHMVVLGSEKDMSAGFNIRYIQLWEAVDLHL